MKHTRLVLVLLFVFSSWSFAQTNTLTILFAEDTHSNLAPIGDRTFDMKGTIGGIARAATLIEEARNTDKNVLVVHTGDAFVGDILYTATLGSDELKLMAKVGFDVMTLGYRELESAPGILEKAFLSALPGSTLSVVSTNMILEERRQKILPSFIDQTVVRDIGGIKVGIFALGTSRTTELSKPLSITFDENFNDCALRTVADLKEIGCSVIICLSRLGLAADTHIAESVPGIDVIIGSYGHFTSVSKVITNPAGKTTLLTAANAFYTEMGKVTINVGKSSNTLLSNVRIPLTEEIKEHPVVADEVSQAQRQVEQRLGPVFSKPIGYVTDDFHEVPWNMLVPGSKQTNVGTLVTDAFREFTNTDIAMEPGGSTAQVLHQGPIVKNDLYRMIGYGYNEKSCIGYPLVTFSITGDELLYALEKCLETMEVNDEYYPQVSGMTFSSDAGKDIGSRIQEVLIQGKPLKNSTRYSVTTNSMFCDLLEHTYGVNLTNVVMREDVTDYQSLLAYVGKRWELSPGNELPHMPLSTVATETPERFSLAQNYPNPFNPSTSIRYALPSSLHVRLTIHDVLGREVATLVDEEQNAGWKEVVWNADACMSGTYFYRLTMGTFSETRTMLLLK